MTTAQTPPHLAKLDQYAFTAPFEGEIPYLYVDSEGNVTAGIGFMLPDTKSAHGLPWIDDVKPTLVTQDYLRVRALPCGRKASWYKPFSSCRLSPEGMRQVFESRCHDVESQMRHLFGWDALPRLAQIGLIDMGYNMGVSKFRRKFPLLQSAVRVGDWGVVADESHRVGISEDRNEQTAALFRACVAP